MKNSTATKQQHSGSTPVRAKNSAAQREATDLGRVASTGGTAAHTAQQARRAQQARKVFNATGPRNIGRASLGGDTRRMGLRKTDVRVTPPHERGKKQAQADTKRAESPNRMLALLQDSRNIAFRQPSGEPWVSLPRPGGGYDHHRVENSRVVSWLMEAYTHAYGEVPDKRQAENAMMTFAAKVRVCDEVRPVYDRLAVIDEADERVLYLDLGDGLHVVRLTAGQWEVIDAPSRVAFRRATGYEALPVPVHHPDGMSPGAALERDLRPLLNCPPGLDGDFNYRRMVAWLIAAFYTEGDQALLVLTGEPGSGKSSVAETLRALIDPNSTRHGNSVTTAEGVMFEAVRQYVPCFDNLRHLSDAVSDALANVATGSGQAKRKLYTDDDIISVFAKRPVILNGIHNMVKRPDLVDRALVLTLPTLDERNRRFTKAQLRRTFEERRPRLLGAVLDVVAMALARLPDVLAAHAETGAGHYRLGDFHMFVRAAEPALGWEPGTADRIMRQQQQEKQRASKEQYADIDALTSLLFADPDVARQFRVKQSDNGRVRVLSGAVGEVLVSLATYAREKLGYDLKDPLVGWPKLPKKFAQHLREAETALKADGIRLQFTTSHHRTMVTITGALTDSLPDASTNSSMDAPTGQSTGGSNGSTGSAGSQRGSQGSHANSPSPVSGPLNSGLGSQGSQGSQQNDLLQGKQKRGERERREETENVPSPPSPPSPGPLNSASEAGSQRGGKTGCLPSTPEAITQPNQAQPEEEPEGQPLGRAPGPAGTSGESGESGESDLAAALDALRATARKYATRTGQTEQTGKMEQAETGGQQ